MGERPDYWLVVGRLALPQRVPAEMIPNYDDEPRKRIHQHVWITAMKFSQWHTHVEVCFAEPEGCV